jgi:RNA polymerase sigma factor (sigma-70 family)
MAPARPHPRVRTARPEIDDLLRRLADGERAAFQPLFDTLWPLLRRFATRFLGNEADGDDAAQQALLKVFARAREYDPDREALPWIVTIATNECRTLRKKHSRRKEVGSESLDILAARQASPEQALILHDLKTALTEVFSELRPEDVDTLACAVTDDRAERPDVPAATFRKRVERALDRLRLAWRAKHDVL